MKDFRENRKPWIDRIWTDARFTNSPFLFFFFFFFLWFFHWKYYFISLNFSEFFYEFFVFFSRLFRIRKYKKMKSTHVQPKVNKILTQSAYQTAEKWSDDPTVNKRVEDTRVSKPVCADSGLGVGQHADPSEGKTQSFWRAYIRPKIKILAIFSHLFLFLVSNSLTLSLSEVSRFFKNRWRSVRKLRWPTVRHRLRWSENPKFPEMEIQRS